MKMAKSKFTEGWFQWVYWHDRISSRDLVIPNLKPAGWWDCDIFAILKSGYSEEIEIKISVADYKNDFKKKRNGHQEQYMGREPVKKHDLLAARSTKCPNRFWFMVPSGMLDGIEIPEYAGLIEVCNPDGISSRSGEPITPSLHVAKKAPLLHRDKSRMLTDRKQHEKLRVQLYWRYFTMFSKNQRSLKGLRDTHKDVTHFPDDNY